MTKESTTFATVATKQTIDINTPGMLNGQVIYNVELDSIPDRPWAQPGNQIRRFMVTTW